MHPPNAVKENRAPQKRPAVGVVLKEPRQERGVVGLGVRDGGYGAFRVSGLVGVAEDPSDSGKDKVEFVALEGRGRLVMGPLWHE